LFKFVILFIVAFTYALKSYYRLDAFAYTGIASITLNNIISFNLNYYLPVIFGFLITFSWSFQYILPLLSCVGSLNLRNNLQLQLLIVSFITPLLITSLFSGTINTIGQYRGFMPFEPVIYYLSLIIAINSHAKKSIRYNNLLSISNKVRWMIMVPLIAPFLILVNKNYFNLPFHAWDIMHLPIYSYLHNENKINYITWIYTFTFVLIYIFTFIQKTLIKIIILFPR
jgi:hypothetical protein